MWHFDFQTVNGKGLVMTNIKADNVPVYDNVSVPHFKIDFPTGSKIIRFCDANGVNMPVVDPIHTTFRSIPFISVDGKLNAVQKIDEIGWSFSKTFNEPTLAGMLTINYQVVIRNQQVHNCELSEGECFRFIPKVSYTWLPV